MLIVGLAAFAVYANTLRNGFVYDDLHQVMEDQRIRNWSGLADVFSSGVWAFKWGPSSYYRPLMQTSYLLTYQVAGLRPWAYHLVNVLLHVGASLALFGLAHRVLRESRHAAAGALAAALVFAVHPLHTEPVAWIASIVDLELALFGLLAVWCYMRALDGNRSAYGLALVCFGLALLSKEPAVVLVVVLLAIDLLWAERRSLRAVTLRVSPFLLLVVGYLALRVSVLGDIAPPGLHGQVGTQAMSLTAVYYAAHYMKSCFWPFPLNALYEFRPVESATDPRLLGSLLVCGVFAAALVRLRRDRRVVLAALLFAAPLAPALYVPGLGAGGLAERYVYFPLAGFALAIGIAWLAVGERWGRTAIPWLALCLLLTAAAGATVSRNRVWADEKSLWSDTVSKSPGSAIAHEFLGYAHYGRGELLEAVAEYRTALRLDPHRTNIHINLGAALLALKRYEEAAALYRTALDAGSTMPEARVGIGLALVHTGSYAEARRHLEAAIAMEGRHAPLHDALGVACANLGDFRAAESAFAAAVALEPTNRGYREHWEAARRDLAATRR